MKSCALLPGLAALFLAAAAQAHDLWILPERPALAIGRPNTFRVIFGHNFPQGRVAPKAEFTKAQWVAPNGKLSPLSMTLSGGYQKVTFTPQASGQHLLLGDYVSYYAHGAPMNKLYASKDQLDGVGYDFCYQVFQCAKTVIGAGNLAMRPTGQIIELVPMKDPSTLRVGSLLPVKVLWKGKPFGSAEGEEVDIKAVYSGFQEDEDTFAFLGHPNAQGVCRIKITAPGWWMALVEQRVPAADPSKADKEVYVGTLVFYVGS